MLLHPFTCPFDGSDLFRSFVVEFDLLSLQLFDLGSILWLFLLLGVYFKPVDLQIKLGDFLVHMQDGVIVGVQGNLDFLIMLILESLGIIILFYGFELRLLFVFLLELIL